MGALEFRARQEEVKTLLRAHSERFKKLNICPLTLHHSARGQEDNAKLELTLLDIKVIHRFGRDQTIQAIKSSLTGLLRW